MPVYREPPQTLEQVIAPYPDEIKSLCLQIRTAILSVLPAADEGIYGGKAVANVLYSVNGERNVICGFQPADAHVKVFFHGWQVLKDHGVRLAGSGKHARHIKCAPDDTSLTALSQYVCWVRDALSPPSEKA